MCKVDGCTNILRGGFGYCSKHYQRFKKYGNIDGLKPQEPIEVRFWRFVEKCSDDECWNWTGQKIRGYGRISIGARGLSSEGAHRLSWKLHNKQEIPNGMFVMHKCDNPSCVNPNHLTIGTPKDNFDDMVSKGRRKQVIPVGEQNGKSILTKEMAQEIRASQLGNAELAKVYGVFESCIRGVKSFRTWKHI